MKKSWNALFHGPWSYWVGAIILAILNILVLYVRQLPWGVTTNIEEWSLWVGSQIRLIPYQGIDLSDLLLSSGTYLNVGVVLGAFWATLSASQARFRPIRDKKFFISALIGGIFMGYGARIAYGCNIGGLLNGIASSSLTAWIFAAAVMIGTWIGTKLLIRFLV
jgi:uncharacterized protein